MKDKTTSIVPMAMQFAQPLLAPCAIEGQYDTVSQTWSHPSSAKSTAQPIETGTGGHNDTDTDTVED